MGNIYKKLSTCWMEETGIICVLDSALSKINYHFLIKSAQDHFSVGNDWKEIITFRKATSVRQAYD